MITSSVSFHHSQSFYADYERFKTNVEEVLLLCHIGQFRLPSALSRLHFHVRLQTNLY